MELVVAVLFVVGALAGMLVLGNQAQQTHTITVPLSPERAQEVSLSTFGKVLWELANSQSTFTMAKRAVLERNRFNLSIDVSRASNGSQVDVWMSYGPSAFRITPAAAMAVIRARNKVIEALAQAVQ